ncbi:hypothetical protein [Ekhidna sp.]|uniref:hypothetical protein n=1 Tax=Ekhidna sp. TaxID=2608089 RepID=UPI003C7AB753
MNNFTRATLILASLIFVSCDQHAVDFDQAKKEILAMHHAQRDFHFGKDSIAFLNQLSEDFISVNRGEITRPKREATLSKYNSYFSSVEFVKWDDLANPIFRFSDDGSIAYTIVDKIVEVTYQDESGEKQTGQTHFAWTAIYRKTEEGWKIECVTSTNE